MALSVSFLLETGVFLLLPGYSDNFEHLGNQYLTEESGMSSPIYDKEFQENGKNPDYPIPNYPEYTCTGWATANVHFSIFLKTLD